MDNDTSAVRPMSMTGLWPWHVYEVTLDDCDYQVSLTKYGDPIEVKREQHSAKRRSVLRICWTRSPHYSRLGGDIGRAIDLAQETNLETKEVTQ
jgi:hypothetical protein